MKVDSRTVTWGKNCTFNLHGNWRLCFNRIVSPSCWSTKGAAEAQLALLLSGYSKMLADGTIKHVGSRKCSYE
jgi:hypothetical protein